MSGSVANYMEPFVPIPPPGMTVSFIFLFFDQPFLLRCERCVVFLTGEEPWVPDDDTFEEPLWVTHQRLEWLAKQKSRDEFIQHTKDHMHLDEQKKQLARARRLEKQHNARIGRSQALNDLRSKREAEEDEQSFSQNGTSVASSALISSSVRSSKKKSRTADDAPPPKTKKTSKKAKLSPADVPVANRLTNYITTSTSTTTPTAKSSTVKSSTSTTKSSQKSSSSAVRSSTSAASVTASGTAGTTPATSSTTSATKQTSKSTNNYATPTSSRTFYSRLPRRAVPSTISTAASTASHASFFSDGDTTMTPSFYYNRPATPNSRKLPASMLCDTDAVRRGICFGCKQKYAKCFETRYRELCLHGVLDYLQEVENAAESGREVSDFELRKAYHNVYISQVRVDLKDKYQLYEMNELLQIPPCMIQGSLHDALKMGSGEGQIIIDYLMQQRMYDVEDCQSYQRELEKRGEA